LLARRSKARCAPPASLRTSRAAPARCAPPAVFGAASDPARQAAAHANGPQKGQEAQESLNEANRAAALAQAVRARTDHRLKVAAARAALAAAKGKA